MIDNENGRACFPVFFLVLKSQKKSNSIFYGILTPRGAHGAPGAHGAHGTSGLLVLMVLLVLRVHMVLTAHAGVLHGYYYQYNNITLEYQ